MTTKRLTYIDILLGAVDASRAFKGPRLFVSFLDKDVIKVLRAVSMIYFKIYKE